MAVPPFLKLKPDHKTVLVRDWEVFHNLKDFLLNDGYRVVYETPRVGDDKTGMATCAFHHPFTNERIAMVLGLDAPDEVSQGQAPFKFGFGGKPAGDAKTYIQHLALRTTDIVKFRAYLEKNGAEFLTPIYQDKDSFGPLLQCFSRELLDDEWFFFEFLQRDYDADKIGVKSGVQFVDKTVRSLYVTKQEEFREWMRTRKKRTFLGSLPKTKAHALLREIVDNIDPKGYALTVPAIAKAVA
jgi:hypothetical protein